MTIIPPQKVHPLHTSGDTSNRQVLFDEDHIQRSFSESSDYNKPLARIFRPISIERPKFCPPLYRDISLRSSPSGDFHCKSLLSTLNSDDVADDVIDGGGSPTIILPTDFVPPRHNFLSCSSHASMDQTNNAFTSPTHDAIKLRSDDIVCGRGAPVDFHPGNQAYRELIKLYETRYFCCSRNEKPQIAFEVLETLRKRGARFVKKEKEGCGVIWVEISEQRAYEKVCQSLREGASEARRRLLATTIQAKQSTTVNQILFSDESLLLREDGNYSPIPIL